MTDKQIIVDGVDVSGCENYKDYTLCCSRTPNCNYKKYKRKEQECYEYIKELARFQQKVVPELRKRLRNKEQECARLKHDNGYEVGALEKTIDQLKAENDLFRICHDNEQAKRRKYEQTLIEIKEIAERGFKLSQCNCGAKAELDLILQKISEVGNE